MTKDEFIAKLIQLWRKIDIINYKVKYWMQVQDALMDEKYKLLNDDICDLKTYYQAKVEYEAYKDEKREAKEKEKGEII